MAAFAREAKGRLDEIVDIRRPYSFFELRESKFPRLENLGRLLSQVRHHCGQTMVIEEIESSSANDLQEENEDLAKYFDIPKIASSTSWRLSFYSKHFKTKRGLRTAGSDQFIGYLIIKEDVLPKGLSTRVYESVIKNGIHAHNYVRGDLTWTCRVQGKGCKVKGYLYAQQNGLTNVCAHVALRTVGASFHKDGDITYREMNDLLGIDHKKKKLTNGLTLPQMVKILESVGVTCDHADYSSGSTNAPPVPYQRFVYGSIESGFPSIIIFHTSGNSMHAVPVFGHTFNQDTWVPSAERGYFQIGPGTAYLPSESWVSSFLMHDDNFGSNFCVPRHYLRPVQPSGKPKAKNVQAAGSEWVAHVLSPLPTDIKVSPLEAEVLGLEYLRAILHELPDDGNRWGDRLLEYMVKGQCVFRSILCKGSEYAEHLKKLRGWKEGKIDGGTAAAMGKSLSNQKIWIVEMSVPELFSTNLRKIGEVVIFSERPIPPGISNFTNFVLARLPGYFALRQSNKPKSGSFQFFPSGINSHVALYGAE